jgi:plasmid stabilization system protein ParE
MKVRISRKAADYIRNEASYLRQHSQVAADRFFDRVKSVRRDLALFGSAGFADDTTLVPGFRRLVRDGYRFDYRLGETEIEIAMVSSSVNTPLLNPSDDYPADYEEQ